MLFIFRERNNTIICLIMEFQEVQRFLQNVNQPTHDREQVSWNTAVKFLMARKFDGQRALDLFQNHEVN